MIAAACQRGSLYEVEELIRAGANVDEAGDDGTIPLVITAEKGRDAVAAALLAAGAAVDKAGPSGYTALHVSAAENRIALSRRYADVVCALCAAGAMLSTEECDHLDLVAEPLTAPPASPLPPPEAIAPPPPMNKLPAKLPRMVLKRPKKREKKIVPESVLEEVEAAEAAPAVQVDAGATPRDCAAAAPPPPPPHRSARHAKV
ncbi:hypothetical protein M885DRAFT_623040 [Pelagophyceae sp. CCMP2097]|nr:hypothetical protein M885DRAFT_623040 [Pelagophyceae sp. CCMP2097]